MRDFIYGIHDTTGESSKVFGDRLAYMVFTEAVGLEAQSGRDYSEWSSQGINVIARLNHGYGNGTIPVPSLYSKFANSVATFVATSKGCAKWIIGNEVNHAVERPSGMVIEPRHYADCYVQCKRAVPDGHRLLVAAIAPWNNQTVYPGNAMGDWILYFEDVLEEIMALGVIPDGITLHTYTHGSDPDLIFSQQTMEYPFTHRNFNFQCYREYMRAIPEELRHLPVYITETDQDVAWEDANRGWVQNAYKEIDMWNSVPLAQQIHALCLYRWPEADKWFIKGKYKVYDDFRAAMMHGYTINGSGNDDDNNGGNDMTTVELPLINSKFEDGFRQVDDIGELTVAEDWHPWWHWESARPEYKEATPAIDPRRVRSGNAAQQWFNSFKKHTAGIYQRVSDVPVGAALTFEAWVQAFVSDKDDFGQSDGRYRMRIGLNPYGGIDPESEDVVWSDDGHAIQPYDEYQYLSVEAVAHSDRCTVFVWGQNEWAQKHCNGYVDDCKLLARIEESEPEPPPGEGFSEEEIREFARDEAERVILEAFEAFVILLRG